ncbi:type IV secretion system protein [Roseomonas mucosa]|uniref:type IV secretion system protein n=1 Tax=Roseomonas mucosa TaxID=207340 RepID=UPI0028CF09B2|nr:type IV secretion system protein [Roseomonas mucosa]MDT8315413.1 type IV secretion system protein [Roseomonas mucosa]MDT8361674.1 type IV secretion system protein [Roseomonas mucosa]
MNGWDIFTRLYDLVAIPLLTGVDAMIAAMTGWVAGWLKVALVVYVTGRLMWQALVQNGEPLSEVERLIVMGAAAVALVTTVGGYGPWARDVLLNGLGPEVGRALAGALGERPVTGGLFDEIWGKAWVSGLAIYRSLPWSIAGLGLCIIVVFYWIIAVFAIAIAFLVWMKAFIILALLVGVGPIFAGLWVFPLFRHMAIGWLNTVFANIVLQILSTALLALLLSAETQLLSQVATLAAAGGMANEIRGVQMLLAGMVLFVACGWITYQLPGIASAITGGFAGYALPYVRSRGRDSSNGGGGGPPPQVEQQQKPAVAPAAAPAPIPLALPRPPVGPAGPSMSNR